MNTVSFPYSAPESGNITQNKRKSPTELLVLAGLLIVPAKLSANLISNGSFESPAGVPGLNSTRPTGWSGFGSFVNGLVHGPGVVLGSAFHYPDPFDGDQFVDIGTGSLTAAFTVTTPGEYLLTWRDNSLTTGWNGSYGVEIKDSSSATVLFTAYSYSYVTPSPPWRALALVLPHLAAATYTLTFGPGTTYTFLDGVSVDLRPETPTPDSGSTAPLLATALLGAMALSRGKRLR